MVLGVLVVAQFMVVLDSAIVNVALPSIQSDLGFSEASLAWVVNAYILVFGGFMLAGGRAADIVGRRRMFVVGLVLFSVSSLACGLAPDPGALIGFRAAQGLGAAILSPAALSILTTTFREPAERNRALGIWGAIAGIAAGAGVLAGGILTAGAGWQWVFFVNVPVGAALLAATVTLPHDVAATPRPHLDLGGATSATAGLCVLVYAVFDTTTAGWLSARTAGLLLVAVALLAGFVIWEHHARSPLIPLSVFRARSLSGANIANLLVGATLFSTFFFLTLYLQDVLHYSPLRTGLAQLPLCAAQVLGARIASRAAIHVGARLVVGIGLVLVAGSLILFTQLSPTASYAVDLLVPSVLFGLGLSAALVGTFIAGQERIPERLAGVAAGLINTTLNIGGALGLAVFGAVATKQTRSLLARVHRGPETLPQALTAGFHRGWAAGAAAGVLGVIVALAVVGRRETSRLGTDPVAHREGGPPPTSNRQPTVLPSESGRRTTVEEGDDDERSSDDSRGGGPREP